ncbi:uncharacterized protein LOC117342777 [Pecten maximus]|uniref:uncharacterized protein LOC117342777 n=1 Tax=Pecten maximus TaxID=6579 RepID=UPI0014586415|nr:uncharacterized protein LOC117342777 [Pecten maximus]XP_033760926.1 uncharacterized protein LOC117342777 [Pecten maximus]
MRLLSVIVVCLLTNSVEGFLGIGRFFGSARRSAEKVANVIEQELSEYRRILQQDVVPEARETLEVVRTSVTEIVKIAGSLEKRIEETLQNVDLIERTRYRMDNLADVIIIASMVFLYVVIGLICDNIHSIILYVSFQFIRVVCVIIAIMLSLRLMHELVLREHMSTASATYCTVGAVLLVFVCVGLHLVYQVLPPLGFAVRFILLGLSFMIYCTIDGPCRWTYGAYQYGCESKSKTGLVLSISLPWLTPLAWMGVFHLLAGDVGDECSEQTAFLHGLLVAYVVFQACANYLRIFHLRPEPQLHARNIYNQNNFKGQKKSPVPADVKYSR